MTQASLTILWIVLLAAAIGYLPFFRKIKGLSFKTLVVLFLIKVITGQLYVLIYTYYYEPQTADIHRFFNDGRILFSALANNPMDYLRMLTGIGGGSEHLAHYYETMGDWYRPWHSPIYNDNRILIRFNAFMSLFSFGIIQVHVVIANFVSLAGFVAIYKFAMRHLPQEKYSWLIPGIFLMPSVLFWSSGIIKETLLFPVIGFFLLYTDNLLDNKTGLVKNMVISAIMLGMLLILKAYILFLFLPCYIAFRIAVRSRSKVRWVIYPAVIVVYFSLVLAASQVFPQYNLIAMVASKQQEFMNFSLSVNVGSLIHEIYLAPTASSIARYLPRGFINTLLYPHPLQPLSPVMLMSAIENLFIIFMAGMITFHAFRSKKLSPLAWLGIWLTIITFTFVGTITQVSGGLVRYKAPALPFLWMAFVSVVPLEKYTPWLASRFPFNLFLKKHQSTETLSP